MCNTADGNKDDIAYQAKLKALTLLNYSSRSRKGLYEKLLASGFGNEAAETAVSLMEEYGYINDRKFSDDYVACAVESKGHGRFRILNDLCGKGVSREVAAESLDSYFEEIAASSEDKDRDAELDNAVRLLEKRFRRSDPGSLDYAEKRRAYGYLTRRGFGHGTICRAFGEFGNSTDDFEDIY